MEIIIELYTYLTKLHFLQIKKSLTARYVRDDFDYFVIEQKNIRLKVCQDGLIYIRSRSGIEHIDALTHWLKSHLLSKLYKIDDRNSTFLDLLLKKKLTIMVLDPNTHYKDIFEKLGRQYDYTLHTKHITKRYGDGLIIFESIKYPRETLKELVEYQILFADYQNLINHLLSYNKKVFDNISLIREKEKTRSKELPDIINDLIEKRISIGAITKKVIQLDNFISQREERCKISNVLKDLKLDDFHEMIRLNNYTRDQFTLTDHYLSYTINLTEFILKENEQKELNILQVIFAIGTIAAIVSLGAMPGSKIFLKIIGSEVTGNIVSFDVSTLVFWTVLSVFIGMALFVILNYLFLYAKKFRIVRPFKKKHANNTSK